MGRHVLPFHLSTNTTTSIMLALIKKLAADERFCFISLLLLALFTLSAPTVIAKFIEGATRQQCLQRDWPADKHAIHMDFCKEYGYPTK